MTTEALFVGQPVSKDTDGRLAWAVNAIKAVEKWARQLSAGGLVYDNAASGLAALNVQDAIDVLAAADADVDSIALHALCGGI